MIANRESISALMKACRFRQFPAAVALVLFAIAPGWDSGLRAQRGDKTTMSTLSGVVRDADGRSIRGTTVQLQANGVEVQTKTSDSQGEFRFWVPRGVTVTLSARMAGIGEATAGPLVLTDQSKRVVLLLKPAQPSGTQASSADQPAFFDQPQFTVAGVTDTTNLGGHGSNATSRTKAELTKDVATLSPANGQPTSASSAIEKPLLEKVKANPDDFVANHEAGKLLASNGNDAGAVQYLERAARLRPDDFDNSRILALVYERTGRLERARETAHALLQEHEQVSAQNKAEVLHLLAEIEERSGKPLDAVRRYQEAAELAPTEPNLFDWGAELLLHHAPEPATEVFTRGNRLFPESSRMLMALGISWYVRGSYDKAVEHLGQASDLVPNDPAPYMFLGRIRAVDTGRSTIYQEKLQRFTERHPDNAWANYYHALSLLKDRAGPEDTKTVPLIESLLEKAVRLDPKLGLAYLQLGSIYSESADLTKAISAYQKAADADPKLEEAHYRLAQAYKRAGETAKSQSELQLYNKISKEAAAKEEQQRREIQQFVYSTQGRSSTPPQ